MTADGRRRARPWQTRTMPCLWSLTPIRATTHRCYEHHHNPQCPREEQRTLRRHHPDWPTPSTRSRTSDPELTCPSTSLGSSPPPHSSNPCATGSDLGEDTALPPTVPRHRPQNVTVRAATGAPATCATTYSHPAGPPCHHTNGRPPSTCHQCPLQQGKGNPTTEYCAQGDSQAARGELPGGHSHNTDSRRPPPPARSGSSRSSEDFSRQPCTQMRHGSSRPPPDGRAQDPLAPLSGVGHLRTTARPWTQGDEDVHADAATHPRHPV